MGFHSDDAVDRISQCDGVLQSQDKGTAETIGGCSRERIQSLHRCLFERDVVTNLGGYMLRQNS